VSEDEKTAREKVTERTAARRAAQTEASADAPAAYSAERLIAEAPAFLGCESYVAAGALYGAGSDMTVDDAKAAVKDWLEREISPPEEE
jgi:hypothetical protein